MTGADPPRSPYAGYLLFHLAADCQRALVAFGTPSAEPPDTDEVTYWSQWEPGTDGAQAGLRGTRIMASAWSSVRGPAELYVETARAVLHLAHQTDPRQVVTTQGRRLTIDALLRTLAVEAAVHQLDLDPVLAGPPASAVLAEVRGILRPARRPGGGGLERRPLHPRRYRSARDHRGRARGPGPAGESVPAVRVTRQVAKQAPDCADGWRGCLRFGGPSGCRGGNRHRNVSKPRRQIRQGMRRHDDVRDEGNCVMRYMLLMNYEGGAGCDVPMGEWAPEDVAAHIEFQHALGRELTEAGELVDAQGLAAPDTVTVVTWDGRNAPVVNDGPFAESKEFLAGYWIVDVESPQRALEIAAKASTAPGKGGVPIQQPIEVRQVMAAPAAEA